MLDLMTVCWAQDPENRPSAAQVRMIASSPQFCHLSDAVCLETPSDVLSATSVFVEGTAAGGLFHRRGGGELTGRWADGWMSE